MCLQVERVLNQLLVPESHGCGKDSHKEIFQGLKVTSMQRVENPQYWNRFNTERQIIARQVAAYLEKNYCTLEDLNLGMDQLCQTELNSLGGPELMKEANEVYLFHGSEKWLDISLTGFEVKYAGKGSGSAYGRGIYFAESPSKVNVFGFFLGRIKVI